MKLLSLFLLIFCFVSHLSADESDELIFCNHGLETLDWVLEGIAVAEQSVEISAPLMGGEIGHRVLQAVEQRLAETEGVQVYLLTNPLLIEDADIELIKNLGKRYPQRFYYTFSARVPMMQPAVTTIHNHMKLIVIDERYYIAGGTNLHDRFCSSGIEPVEGEGGRDSDLIGRGAQAVHLRKIFFNLLAVWENYQKTKRLDYDPSHFADSSRYFPIHLDQKRAWISAFESSNGRIQPRAMETIFSGAMDRPNKISSKYVELVRQAEKSLVIGNLYFNPTDRLFKTLVAAVNRDLDFTLYTNGLFEGVSPPFNKLFAWGNRVNYIQVLFGRTFYFWQAVQASEAPLKKSTIYEYHVPGILYHKKVMVVDDRYLVIGSYNMGTKSEFGDYELVLVIDSPAACAKQMQIFEVDRKHSKQVERLQALKWHFDPWTAYKGGAQNHCHGFL